MKFISWNVNGLRACVQKGFLDFFSDMNADFVCLQETKLQEGQISLSLPGYEQYWCYAEKKGYSGTAIFTKHTPAAVTRGIGIPELDNEGRVLTLEYPEFFLVNCYTPNAQRGLARLDHRMQWDDAFRSYLCRLDQQKPVILCGDLNVAHKEIDLKNPKSNRGNAGFSDEERESFTKTLECGFTDTFRHLNPDKTEAYTWWSYMFNARQNNAGWRIDYFLVSDRIREAVYKTPIYSDIMGSDHCPVGLELDILCNGGIWSSDIWEQPTVCTPQEKPAIFPSTKAVIPCIALVAFLCGLLCGLLLIPKAKLHPTLSDAPAQTQRQDEAIATSPGLILNTNIQNPQRLIPTIIIEPEYSQWEFQYYNEGLQITQISLPYVSTTSARFPAFTDAKSTWGLGKIDVQADLSENATPNFWLRLEMPEEVKNTFDGSWHPEIKIASFHSHVSPDLSKSFTVHQYYTAYFADVDGWFIYGTLPEGCILLLVNSKTGDPICSCTVSARS